MRRQGSPLSKTETSELEAPVATKGMHSSPASSGSLERVNGNDVMVSPILVPPPSLENTVRPSSVSWPPRASKLIMAIMSPTPEGGRMTS